MVEYKALYINDLFEYNDGTPVTYNEEELIFTDKDFEIDVDIVLFDKQWILFKGEEGNYSQMSKYDFVKELQLPYTEIDID